MVLNKGIVNKLEEKVKDEEFNNWLNAFDSVVPEKEKLFAVILGASGGGKSYACGTLPGKTLFLNVSLESHGVKAAQTCAKKLNNGAKILGISIDADGNADNAFNSLVSKLNTLAENGGVDNVVVDSLNMIETAILRRTERFANECRSSKGDHNTFQETPVICNMFYEIFTVMEKVKKKGINILATCALEIKGMNNDGSIAQAMVHLSTYGVAQTIARVFPTVLVVGRVGEEHVFQFKSDLKRESKDSVLKKVLKTENFAPRVQGLDLDSLPETATPDLNKLLEIIEGGSGA